MGKLVLRRYTKKRLVEEAKYYIKHTLELSREFNEVINKTHTRILFYAWLIDSKKYPSIEGNKLVVYRLPSDKLLNNAFNEAWQEVMQEEQ